MFKESAEDKPVDLRNRRPSPSQPRVRRADQAAQPQLPGARTPIPPPLLRRRHQVAERPRDPVRRRGRRRKRDQGRAGQPDDGGPCRGRRHRRVGGAADDGYHRNARLPARIPRGAQGVLHEEDARRWEGRWWASFHGELRPADAQRRRDRR